MIEDDETVEEMRGKAPKPPRLKRSFMAASELRLLRMTVLKVSQAKLAEQLIKPDDGLPVGQYQVCFWETGVRNVPLWAARRVRDLAEAARRYDFKREG